MNYLEIYDRLIYKAKNRKEDELKGYIEKHHIIPSAMGGSDDIINIVKLTGREHFIAHLLLAKIYPSSNMVHAAWKMAYMNQAKIKINSKIYEMLKILHSKKISKILSEGNKQRIKCTWCDIEGGIAIMKRWHFDSCLKNPNCKPRKPIKRKPHSITHKQKLADSFKKRLEHGFVSPLKGKKANSEKQILGNKNMRNTRIAKGEFKSDERRKIELEEKQKRIEFLKLPTICPHCGKSSKSNSIMKRWHFNNCKKFR